MSRRNLTSNKRSFRTNPRSFIDKVSESPIDITIDDGVNPPFTVRVDPVTAKIKNEDELPPLVDTDTSRPTTPREVDEF